MTQTHKHDRRTQRLSARTEILPIVILAAILAAIVLVIIYQQSTTERMGDTNSGPSMQTVTPAPSPSTSPAVSTPNPTTEQPNTPPAP